MDDVTFGCNGRNAITWTLQRAATAMSGVAIPGWSLMSMNALVLFVFFIPEVLLPLTVILPKNKTLRSWQITDDFFVESATSLPDMY